MSCIPAAERTCTVVLHEQNPTKVRRSVNMIRPEIDNLGRGRMSSADWPEEDVYSKPKLYRHTQE